MRMRLAYFDRWTPLSGVAVASTGEATVFQPLRVLRWIRTRCRRARAGRSPGSARRAARGVLSPSLSPTFVRTSTVTSALVAGGDLAVTW